MLEQAGHRMKSIAAAEEIVAVSTKPRTLRHHIRMTPEEDLLLLRQSVDERRSSMLSRSLMVRLYAERVVADPETDEVLVFTVGTPDDQREYLITPENCQWHMDAFRLAQANDASYARMIPQIHATKTI